MSYSALALEFAFATIAQAINDCAEPGSYTVVHSRGSTEDRYEMATKLHQQIEALTNSVVEQPEEEGDS
jgi:dihydroxyacetone kinase DhaKLM complex PTS-EIIA-like component DhaM